MEQRLLFISSPFELLAVFLQATRMPLQSKVVLMASVLSSRLGKGLNGQKSISRGKESS